MYQACPSYYIHYKYMSELLNTLYINEITTLHNILHDLLDKDISTSDKITKTNNISHDTYNFVGDSSSLCKLKFSSDKSSA